MTEKFQDLLWMPKS